MSNSAGLQMAAMLAAASNDFGNPLELKISKGSTPNKYSDFKEYGGKKEIERRKKQYARRIATK